MYRKRKKSCIAIHNADLASLLDTLVSRRSYPNILKDNIHLIIEWGEYLKNVKDNKTKVLVNEILSIMLKLDENNLY